MAVSTSERENSEGACSRSWSKNTAVEVLPLSGSNDQDSGGGGTWLGSFLSAKALTGPRRPWESCSGADASAGRAFEFWTLLLCYQTQTCSYQWTWFSCENELDSGRNLPNCLLSVITGQDPGFFVLGGDVYYSQQAQNPNRLVFIYCRGVK